MESSELLKEFKAKMIEKAKEFYAADTTPESVEELADVLELVLTALSALGLIYEELEEVLRKTWRV